jgi:hypothetical protein
MVEISGEFIRGIVSLLEPALDKGELETGDLDLLFKEAKKSLVFKTKEEQKADEYGKLFDVYQKKLRDKLSVLGIRSNVHIINSFMGMKEEVVSRAVKMNIEKDCIPFVPILPISYFGIYGLLNLIDGCTYYDIEDFNVNLTHSLYFLYNVGLGKDFEFSRVDLISQANVVKEFIVKESKKNPLNVFEAISLCFFTDILSTRSVICNPLMDDTKPFFVLVHTESSIMELTVLRNNLIAELCFPFYGWI